MYLGSITAGRLAKGFASEMINDNEFVTSIIVLIRSRHCFNQ